MAELDTTPLGSLAADVMETLTERYGDEFIVRTVAIVVEVDSEKTGHLIARCSDDRPWLLHAFLGEAMDSIEAIRSDFRDRERGEDD